MPTTLAAPETPSTPPVPVIDGLPVDISVAFSRAKGDHHPRTEKRQRKLIARVGGFVSPYLEEGETVMLVTLGCRPISSLEQLTSGAMVYHLKRAALLFTDRRVLVVPVRTNLTPQPTLSQVRYAGCERMRLRGGSLLVEYKVGGKERFHGLRAAERAKLKKAILPTLRLGDAGEGGQGRTHLCPRCTAELAAGRFHCQVCDLEFKTPREALRLALVYPGGGYFYCRQVLIGILDALIESTLIFGLVMCLNERNDPEARAVLGSICLALAIEKAVSAYHAYQLAREYLPKDRAVQALEIRKEVESGSALAAAT